MGPICFSPDGRKIVAGNGDRSATVFEVETGAVQFRLEGDLGPLTHVRFSPDGQTIVAASDALGEEHSLIFWDAATGAERNRIPEAGYFDFSPVLDSRLVAHKGPEDLILLNLDTGKKQTVECPPCFSVSFSAKGDTIAVGFIGEVRLYDVPSLELLDTLPLAGGPIPDVAFSAEGQTLAIPNWGGYMQLWNRKVREVVGRLPLPADWIISAAFSPDGNTLAVSALGTGVHLFRAPTFEQISAWARE